jgi:hypothetical protein
VNFEDITMLAGTKNTGTDDGTCLGQGVSTTYLNMASKEYNDMSRIGYQYFGHQVSGGYGQWPLTDLTNAKNSKGIGMCDEYDPRFRPWYASTATGPKDVVLILDKSGSMGDANRIALAKAAALAVIDTLSDYDYVGIVLFNNNVQAYGDELMPANPANKQAAFDWINSNVYEGGGTNFQDSLNKGFEILRQSLASGSTSMCMRAVMFLTDGVADFYDEDYTKATEQVKELSVAMFTYAIGSGADATVMKKLACDNRGIFYTIPDGGDLEGIMSSYYQYFALGTRTCAVRWIEYQDSITASTLLAGCMPFYSPTTSQKTPPLRGVSCVDLNVVAPLDLVKKQATYKEFYCQTSQISEMCEALYLRDVDLAHIRSDTPSAEMCDGDSLSFTPDMGYCVDPTCKDDLTYKDKDGYYCDQWVGEICTDAVETWGFSQADEDALVKACPYSCLQCGRKASVDECVQNCEEVTGNIPCMNRIRPSGAQEVEGDEDVAAGPFLALLALGWAL